MVLSDMVSDVVDKSCVIYALTLILEKSKNPSRTLYTGMLGYVLLHLEKMKRQIDSVQDYSQVRFEELVGDQAG